MEPRWVAERSGEVYSWCRSCLRETKRAWSAANPEKRRASQRARQARWRKAHREETRARVLASVKANPELYRDRVRRRRSIRAGLLLVIRVEADHCGVCLGPLTDEVAPHPMSTEIGHEPPLAVVAREGWLIGVERPEHRACNRSKGDRLDCELVA